MYFELNVTFFPQNPFNIPQGFYSLGKSALHNRVSCSSRADGFWGQLFNFLFLPLMVSSSTHDCRIFF